MNVYTIASVQTLVNNVATVSDIIMGKNDTVVQTVTLIVAPAAATVTIASNIVGVGDGSNDNDVVTLAVRSSVSGSSQLVTFGGLIGPGVEGDNSGGLAATNAENDIDVLHVGSATLAGAAKFNSVVTAKAVTVFGGNAAGEDGHAEFAGDLNTTSILLQDSGTNSSTVKAKNPSGTTAPYFFSIFFA